MRTVPHFNRRILSFLASLVLSSLFLPPAVLAVQVGDSAWSVECEFGKALTKLKTDEGVVWVYPHQARITLKDGFVTKVSVPRDALQRTYSSTKTTANRSSVQDEPKPSFAVLTDRRATEAAHVQPSSRPKVLGTPATRAAGSMEKRSWWDVMGLPNATTPMVSFLLLIPGIILTALCALLLLLQAFTRSIWWGLAYLLLPLGALVFVIMNWGDCKTTFLVMLFVALPLQALGRVVWYFS